MKFGRFEPWIEEQESHFKNGYGASVIRDPTLITAMVLPSSGTRVVTANQINYLNWLYLNKTINTLGVGISRMARQLQATSW